MTTAAKPRRRKPRKPAQLSAIEDLTRIVTKLVGKPKPPPVLEDFRQRLPHRTLIEMMEKTGPDECGPFVSYHLLADAELAGAGCDREGIDRALTELFKANLVTETPHRGTGEMMIGLKSLVDPWRRQRADAVKRVMLMAEEQGFRLAIGERLSDHGFALTRGNFVEIRAPLWRLQEYLQGKVA